MSNKSDGDGPGGKVILLGGVAVMMRSERENVCTLE